MLLSLTHFILRIHLTTKVLNTAETPVKIPPQIISTITTLTDHPFNAAMLVKLYVPYATTPKTKPFNKIDLNDPLCNFGIITNTATPKG